MSPPMSSLPPLTHHEILGLVAPFTRAGWRVDLAATDRSARRLAFEPRQRAADGALPALRETLRLDLGDPGRAWLTREWRPEGPGAQAATLRAGGRDPGELLARLATVPPARQFAAGDGFTVAFAHEAEPGGALALRGASARMPGLTVEMSVTPVRGFPARIALRADDGVALALPRDLLAVLGRAWGELRAVRGGWEGSIELRGGGERRSRDAEERLLRTLGHLCRTLAEPPSRFRQCHRAARWAVTLREMVPLSLLVGVVALGFLLRGTGGRQDMLLALLANVAPPLMMGYVFMRREMPRIGLPRPPRGPADGAWQPQPAGR